MRYLKRKFPKRFKINAERTVDARYQNSIWEFERVSGDGCAFYRYVEGGNSDYINRYGNSLPFFLSDFEDSPRYTILEWTVYSVNPTNGFYKFQQKLKEVTV